MARFQIALTSVKFDENYENVLRFETREEQQQFFGVSSLFSNAINVNFTARNLLTTDAVFRQTDGQSLKELLTKNYAIIKDTKHDEYLYYFITSISQEDDGQVHLRLQLDVFQTFYIDITFSDCMIQRANLNRFVDNGDDTVAFDGTLDSKLFEREPIKNVAQHLSARHEISVNTNSNDELQNATDDVLAWLDENVLAWVYYFVDGTHSFVTYESQPTTTTTLPAGAIGHFYMQTSDSGMSMPVGVIAYPITKTGSSMTMNAIDRTGTTIATMHVTGVQDFLDLNGGASYVWGAKVSQVSPLRFYETGTSTIEYSIDGNNLTITAKYEYEDGVFRNIVTNNQNIKLIRYYANYCFFSPLVQRPTITSSLTLDKKFDFSKNDIIGAIKQTQFNPKLLSSDFYSLRIKADNTSDGFDYDLQKLNHNNLVIERTEVVTPDISRIYARIQGTEGTCYLPDTSSNYTGDVAQNDASLILASSAYQTMIANNKNYFLQNSINRWTNFGTSALASGAAIATGAATGNVIGIVGGALGVAKTGVDLAKSFVNENLTVDNLKNAPGSIRNAQGNIMLSFAVAPIKTYVEEYDALPNEKQIANDYMDAFGFTYNRIDNVKNNDNIRHYHNYVQATISEVNGVSNEIRQEFVNAFERGVRFWNAANIQDADNPFDYTMENYENWLAE